MAAATDDTVELSAQGGEIRDLAVHFRKMLASNYIHSFARTPPLIRKAEQLADLRKRKTEIALVG